MPIGIDLLDWYSFQSLMSFPANPDTGMSQARLEAGKTSPGREKDIIVQSRETGDVMPQPGQPPVKGQPKSYAHFVAGGYVMNYG